MEKKNIFEMPKAEIIIFGKDDIITTSNGDSDDVNLPIDPAAINFNILDLD